MKLKQLIQIIEQLNSFENPLVILEQYNTPPYIAANMILQASEYGDIEGKTVLDLGCGPGILGITSSLLNCCYVVGIDIDRSVLIRALDNCQIAGVENNNIEFIQADVFDILNSSKNPSHKGTSSSSLSSFSFRTGAVPSSVFSLSFFDTVVMNPPFGTRLAGADLMFLKVACLLCTGTIYSLHKSVTRQFLLQKIKSWGLQAESLGTYEYSLPPTYKFHHKSNVDISVDLIRVDCSEKLKNPSFMMYLKDVLTQDVGDDMMKMYDGVGVDEKKIKMIRQKKQERKGIKEKIKNNTIGKKDKKRNKKK